MLLMRASFYREQVGKLPATARGLIAEALVALGVAPDQQERYLWGLLLDQNGWVGSVAGEPLGLDARCNLAASMLRGMSLTREFARIVLLAGHGSRTRNNPHAAGLDCGACCGQTGEVNARVAAALLNEPEVRQGLTGRGIEIPPATTPRPSTTSVTAAGTRCCTTWSGVTWGSSRGTAAIYGSACRCSRSTTGSAGFTRRCG